MGSTAGLPQGHTDVLVTREVRWFADGPLPTEVAVWFASSTGPVTEEHRTDHYDLRSAESGIGIKYRGQSTFDAKYLLAHEAEYRFAEGVRGLVGDWVKVSRPVADPDVVGTSLIAVEKRLRTRTYRLEVPGPPTGCEVELGEVSTATGTAWSLCFETFGPADLRYEAFRLGISRFLAESPLPDGLRLEPSCSCAYPAWISRRCAVA